jgi:hypothetical protein
MVIRRSFGDLVNAVQILTTRGTDLSVNESPSHHASDHLPAFASAESGRFRSAATLTTAQSDGKIARVP